ncbi:MAG: alpha/beta fold hydrolase [Eubacterium sp.]|nr:alpha/beta fold hydrolase [Eubacterium sp.]
MDIKHNFVEKGTGEALILLHGNGEDNSIFTAQLDEFSKYYRTIALDTRGHGGTPRGNAPFTTRQFADDLAGFMEEHGIAKAHIFGFSDGGNIAMIFAAKYPEMVDKLILNGSNMNTNGVKAYFQLLVELGYRVSKQLNNTAKSEMLGLMVDGHEATVSELATIKAPTLVIAGTHDLIKSSHTKLIAQSIPDSQLVFIKGNHAVARLHPTEFNKIVLDFLRG